MGDRQDIDALLIGALYDELDADDQARLDAHLAAHPADRATMDELARTRAHVRDSLAAMPEAEPAPAISTLLLREAARRAPRRARARAGAGGSGGGVMGWLAGLVRPAAAHPALAGALALALVAGTAGILHERGKVGVEPHAVAPAETTASAPAPARPGDALDRDDAANADTPALEPGPAPTTGYQVGLLDKTERDQTKAATPDDHLAFESKPTQVVVDGKLATSGGKDVGVAPGRHRVALGHGSAGSSYAAKPPAAKKADLHAASRYVEVRTPEPQLKTLDDERSRTLAKEEQQVAQAPAVRGGMGGGGPAGGDAPMAPPPPPPAPPAATRGAATSGAPAYDKNKDAALDEWAKVQHARLVGLVKAGNCVEAGKLGSEIAMRAPAYYAAHVENDRAVRQCKAYIDREKRKTANEHDKSRARNAPSEDFAPAAN